MWTPKRILLSFAGLLLFLAFYVVYVHFLGGIDGFPPLPPDWVADGSGPPPAPPEPRESDVDKKLRWAFGSDCPESKMLIKAEVRKKRFVFATDQVTFLDDGRVLFKPFSIGLFGKEKGDGGFPEINTIRSDKAYLTFDRPIGNLAEISNRKIVGSELQGSVTIISNRSTPQTHDDMEVYIMNGSVFYHESKNMIWTDPKSVVKLLDKQPRPDPTEVKAVGLDIYLAQGVLSGPGEGKKDNAATVQRVVLRSHVDMHLHIDAKSGFLGGEDDKGIQVADARGAHTAHKPDPGQPRAAQQSHLIIQTQGPFTYEVGKELAVFESPPAAAGQEAAVSPGQVMVTREHRPPGMDAEATVWDQKNDQLVCDRLVLQFRKKQAKGRLGRDPRSPDLEIDSARATARPGGTVTLSLDTEVIDAYGTELVYNGPAESRGPETILRGSPMRAVKDAHEIHAQELRLVGADGKGQGQAVYAKGPVRIDLIDGNQVEKGHQYHVLCRDGMTVVKDAEAGRVYDLLTFEGEAAFIDDARKQELQAEKLQLWLEPAPRAGLNDAEADRKQRAANAPRQQPHKIEGFDAVQVRSPDLTVRECQHLTVRFLEGVTARLAGELPDLADVGPGPVAEPGAPEHVALRPSNSELTLPPIKVGEAAPPTAQAPAEAAKPRPGNLLGLPEPSGHGPKYPIDLKAKTVTVYLVRRENKNELQDLVTQGNVHVRQDAAEKDRGFDIRGDTLHLKRFPQGDTLIVWGHPERPEESPARLQMGEMVLLGPKVTINQGDNTARIDGNGAMHVPSNTSLGGDRPARPGSTLTILWDEDMFFDGKDADFRGKVQAYQDDGSLLCERMQVALDRTVSFKEGEKKGRSAKVENVVCHRQVYVADVKKDPAGKLVRYERMIAQELSMDNQGGPVRASGPGFVYLLQYGTVDIAPDPKKGEQPKKPAEEKLHLTRVQFNGRLFSQKQDDGRMAKFYDNVIVFHVPAENPDVELDPDKLPKDGLYLSCEQLRILRGAESGGKTAQVMQASQNVQFSTDRFRGQCKMLTYDPQQEVLVLEGTQSNPIYLEENLGQGREPRRTRITTRVRYDRKTGDIRSDGVQALDFPAQ